ncbi:MAG: YebC/PmpR family DNA-binding transcriptional regulator [Flavobacteriales bacterium]|nr:YebC/PmpR family DNA-binding transcriptional regulator [Flavobacteriales bacterium]
MGRAFEYRKAAKMKRWASMSKNFTRVGKEITIAVKEGGDNPKNNLRLRMAIQNAKAVSMPKENVDRAIKKAMSKEQNDYKELIYEGYAPHGIAVLVETATDNHVRTVSNLRTIFNKCGGTLGNSGSVEFMFERKCFIKIQKPEIDVEELELELIDFGAEEVFEDDDNIVMIYGAFADFGALNAAVEEKGFTVDSTGFERVAMDYKELSDEERADVDKLLERLDEDDDVQYVFTNMK